MLHIRSTKAPLGRRVGLRFCRQLAPPSGRPLSPLARISWLALALAAVFFLTSQAPARAQTARYKIVSGQYVMVGGFWGSWTNTLPDSAQAFVEVTFGLAPGSASARILGSDGASVALTMSDGTFLGSQIHFAYPTNHPYYPAVTNTMMLNYTVFLVGGGVWLAGSIEAAPICCDVPYRFAHYAVRAVQLPDLFTLIFSASDLGLSTNQVFPGDVLGLHWTGSNNRTVCIPEVSCVEQFGPAFGPWQDAVFLFNSSTNFLLGTAAFSGPLGLGAAYTNRGSFRIPPETAPGRYGVEIQIDYQAGATNGVVAELNERNNTDRIASVLTVLPSLAITRILRLDEQTMWLQMSGSVTQQVRVQVSQTLNRSSWVDLTNFPAFRGAVEFRDRFANQQTRFYRAVSP